MNDKKEQTFFQRLVNLVPGSSAPSCSFWFRALADLLFPWALPRNSGHARLFRAKGKPENRECLTPMQPTFFAQKKCSVFVSQPHRKVMCPSRYSLSPLYNVSYCSKNEQTILLLFSPPYTIPSIQRQNSPENLPSYLLRPRLHFIRFFEKEIVMTKEK